MKSVKSCLSYLLLICAIAPLSGRAMAQLPLNWERAQKFDTGVHSSIAILPSGLVISFHETDSITHEISYRIGKVGQTWDDKYYVSWGSLHSINIGGSWPTVAVTKEGYVVLAYSVSSARAATTLKYWAGELDPGGDKSQTITWRIKEKNYDSGFHPSLAFNSNGILAEAHESATSSGIFYRIAHFKSPATKDFNLVWDSGDGGVKYDDGVNPHISINDTNQVIECHQVTKENLLHYRRGTLGATRITFERSVRYDNAAAEPAVALTNKAVAIELNSHRATTFSRIGLLHKDDPGRVDWSSSVEIGLPGYDGTNPAVSTNGVLAVASWTSKGSLYYSVAVVK